MVGIEGRCSRQTQLSKGHLAGHLEWTQVKEIWELLQRVLIAKLTFSNLQTMGTQEATEWTKWDLKDGHFVTFKIWPKICLSFQVTLILYYRDHMIRLSKPHSRSAVKFTQQFERLILIPCMKTTTLKMSINTMKNECPKATYYHKHEIQSSLFKFSYTIPVYSLLIISIERLFIHDKLVWLVQIIFHRCSHALLWLLQNCLQAVVTAKSFWVTLMNLLQNLSALPSA